MTAWAEFHSELEHSHRSQDRSSPPPARGTPRVVAASAMECRVNRRADRAERSKGSVGLVSPGRETRRVQHFHQVVARAQHNQAESLGKGNHAGVYIQAGDRAGEAVALVRKLGEVFPGF